jgi:hypothetical protein
VVQKGLLPNTPENRAAMPKAVHENFDDFSEENLDAAGEIVKEQQQSQAEREDEQVQHATAVMRQIRIEYPLLVLTDGTVSAKDNLAAI